MKKSEKVGLNLKALILDHDLEMLNTLTQKLIGLGMDIESSDSLHRARMLFKQDPMKIQVLITEINFQDGDAFTLIKWMRKKNPNLIALIVTGEADLPSAITAIKLGFADYLEKPVSMKEMQNAILKCRKMIEGLPAADVHTDTRAGRNAAIKTWRPQWHHDLVQLMNESVKYWQYSTGSNRGELAKNSGLWAIQIERNSIRARTMDRYTEIETLPQYPHWDKVLETARYVLRHCPPSSQRFEIEVLLYRLQRLMNTDESEFTLTPPGPSIPDEPGEVIAPVSGPSHNIPVEP